MEQKISGCICSQQAQLCLLPAQAADPAARGENQPGSLLRAAPGPGQASPPLGTGGTRGWEGEGAGKAVPARKKDTGETKGRLKGISLGKSISTWLPLPRRRDPAVNPTSSSCSAGTANPPAPNLLPSSRAVSFPWSWEKGELMKPKVWELQDPAPLGRRGARADPDPSPAPG